MVHISVELCFVSKYNSEPSHFTYRHCHGAEEVDIATGPVGEEEAIMLARSAWREEL